ncbi:MAG: PHP domain-containing protein [Syntrophomonadaceae bacterium]|jgi:predicted metal-dependent phosphoesterase TrpH|nr:PHP domain-containing protein [Syntrophomonadaceae bacterium]
MYFDLHIHTQASDGALTAEQVVDSAVKTGVPGISITDHDTINGLEVALKYKKDKKLEIDLVPGIEINTDWEKSELHILGYYVDYENTLLKERLQDIKDARYERAVKIVKKLQNLGFAIDLEEVKEKAQGELIGRPHIAQVLLEKKQVHTIREAFIRYIGVNTPAYVPRYKFSPFEAIDLIKHSGGTAVLAHPGLVKEQEKIKLMINHGIEGLEVYYPEHNEVQTRDYFSVCKKYDLAVTGGSDFHGYGDEKRNTAIGTVGLNEELYKEFQYRCCRNK